MSLFFYVQSSLLLLTGRIQFPWQNGCELQTPRFVRSLFKDPCIRVAGEVSKALMELADSIRNRRQCPPEILSDHLHEALQDLDAALKSQPKLFLGPSANANANALAFALARQKSSKNVTVSLSSVKTDSSALRDWKSKRANDQAAEPKVLRPTLSKLAITSLEFSEALPFAAFASLLVETVAKLERMIEEVEELGRVANFKEYSESDGGEKVTVICQNPVMPNENNLASHGAD